MERVTRHERPKGVTFAIAAVIGLSACAGAGTADNNRSVPTQVPVTPFKAQAVVIVDVATLRSGPGVEFEPVGALAKGEVIALLGASPARDWYLVTLPTPQGGTNEAWISAEFIAPITPTAPPISTDTPVATTVPSIQLLPVEGGPGTFITVAGAGWRPADTVFVGLDDPSDGQASQLDSTAVVVAATATDKGDIIASFAFPSDRRWASLPSVFVIAQSSMTGETAVAAFSVRFTTQTPTPCGPPSNWLIYIVQPGDILASISRATGASVQELMLANCLSDDRIYAGQRLFVPRLPAPTVTSVPPATLTPTFTGTPSLVPPITPTPTRTGTPTVTLVPPATPPPTPTGIPSPTPTLLPRATPTPRPTGAFLFSP